MLHAEVIFKSLKDPDDTGQVDLKACLTKLSYGEKLRATLSKLVANLDKTQLLEDVEK